MQIQEGKLYDNRTWKYLYPSLKIYGRELMSYLGQFIKLGVGIKDYNVNTKDPCLFILLDTTIALDKQSDIDAYRDRFIKFLSWIKYQYFYVTDYVYEGLDNREQHMVVLKIPQKYDQTYKSFLEGKYSKMYDKSEIGEYFKDVSLPHNKTAEAKRNKDLSMTRKILTKDRSFVPVFAKYVNTRFGTDNPISDFEEAELDFPPDMSEETFNYTIEQ